MHGTGIEPSACATNLRIHHIINQDIFTSFKLGLLLSFELPIKLKKYYSATTIIPLQNLIIRSQHNIFCETRVRPTIRLERSGLPTLVFWPSTSYPSPTTRQNISLSHPHRPRHFAWLLTLHVIVITILVSLTAFCILLFHSNRLWHIGRHMTRASAVLGPFFSLAF